MSLLDFNGLKVVTRLPLCLCFFCTHVVLMDFDGWIFVFFSVRICSLQCETHAFPPFHTHSHQSNGRRREVEVIQASVSGLTVSEQPCFVTLISPPGNPKTPVVYILPFDPCTFFLSVLHTPPVQNQPNFAWSMCEVAWGRRGH